LTLGEWVLTPPAHGRNPIGSDERRKAIVAAAVSLFARKGSAGATTKELAEAAGISEALLFRHSPSKKHLYDEILRLGCEGHPALERLAALEPSTATLVCMTHFMVGYFLLGGGVDRAELDSRLRLVLHSLLEDGDCARELFSTGCSNESTHFLRRRSRRPRSQETSPRSARPWGVDVSGAPVELKNLAWTGPVKPESRPGM
jgi:AcrR family transcriptional regulator